MRKVIIMSGVSGSGKSTYADTILHGLDRHRVRNGCIVSADYFFYGKEGYKFDPSKLSQAHGSCFRSFIDCMRDDYPVIIVDNTNTTVEEISPYVLGAQAYDYDHEIITIVSGSQDWREQFQARNLHNVPLNSIKAQADRIANRRLPPYWNAKTIPASF